MQPTPAKLVVVGIPAHSLFANSTRKFAFYCNLPSMFTTDHHFCLLNIYSRSFWLQYSFSSRQYIDCTTLTNHSSTTSFLKANHANSIGTQSKAFFKSANPKYKLQIRFCFVFLLLFLLSLSEDKHGVCVSKSWLKTLLHFSNVHLLSYQLLNYSLSYV